MTRVNRLRHCHRQASMSTCFRMIPSNAILGDTSTDYALGSVDPQNTRSALRIVLMQTNASTNMLSARCIPASTRPCLCFKICIPLNVTRGSGSVFDVVLAGSTRLRKAVLHVHRLCSRLCGSTAYALSSEKYSCTEKGIQEYAHSS